MKISILDGWSKVGSCHLSLKKLLQGGEEGGWEAVIFFETHKYHREV